MPLYALQRSLYARDGHADCRRPQFRSRRATRSEVIVNENLRPPARLDAREAVGRQIIDEDSADARLYTIVGVVKDFRTVIATGQVDPIVMHPLNYYTSFPRYTPEIKLRWYLMIRLREMSPEALAAVQRKIEEYPSDNNHVLTVYDDLLGDTLSEIRSFRNIVFTVSGITLLIVLMGLVGYLGDEMRRRSKEIALRKGQRGFDGRRAAPACARRAVDCGSLPSLSEPP